MAYRALLIPIIFSFLGVFFNKEAEAQWQDESCSVTFGDNDKFAHCKGVQQTFNTVFIAVHGWNGGCKSTFGQHNTSLFSVMDRRRFYDWDCFEYNSFDLNIDQNASKLIQRMEDLRRLGYENAVFITHSTGGILFLEYLIRRVKDENSEGFIVSEKIQEKLENDLQIIGAMIWAVPINGLKWNLDKVGVFFSNLFGVKQNILPDLDSQSPYLIKLKKRLAAYQLWFSNLDPKLKSHVRTKLYYLHGNDLDDVVKPINENTGRNKKWLWTEDHAELILTDLPHQKIFVFDPSAPESHKFPSIIIDRVALLSVPFKIRIHDVFPENTNASSLQKRQKMVINGLKYYAMENFSAAIPSAIEFLQFMLNARFPRILLIDNLLIDSLLEVFEEKFSNKNHAQIGLSLLNALGKNNFSAKDSYSPGHGSKRFTSKVLELIELIRRNGNTKIQGRKEDSVSLENQKNIDISSINLVNKILTETQHDTVRDQVLNILLRQSKEINASLASDFYAKLAKYAKLKAHVLSGETKEKISIIFSEGIKRGPEFALHAITQASESLNYNGKNVPLWRTFENETFPNLLVEKTRKLNNQKIEALSKKLLMANLNIAQQVGAKGNNFSGAERAIENVHYLLPTTLENCCAPAVSTASEYNYNDFNIKEGKYHISTWPNLEKKYEEKIINYLIRTQ